MGTIFKVRKAKFGEVEENRGFPKVGVKVNWSMFPESTLVIDMYSCSLVQQFCLYDLS